MAGPVTAGSILSRSFAVFGSGWIPFLSISFLIYSPLLLWNLVQTSGDILSPTSETIVSALASLIFPPLATAALIYGVFRHLRGETASIGECLQAAAARWLPVLVLALLVALATGFATLALIIPGIIVHCGLFVAVPALVVEQLPIGQAFSRSWGLTDGYKMSIFGVVLLLTVIGWVAGAVLGLLLMSAGDLTPLSSFLTVVVTVVLSAVQAIAAAVAYHDLRVHKEGLDEEELAAVFE